MSTKKELTAEMEKLLKLMEEPRAKSSYGNHLATYNQEETQKKEWWGNRNDVVLYIRSLEATYKLVWEAMERAYRLHMSRSTEPHALVSQTQAEMAKIIFDATYNLPKPQ